ncbi:hypothetical protein [Mesobacillus zeae]|uniref:hypothetical protein n=1 Tax=Mesobacillus zeae TaxID=1917180 RepID=UPI00300B6597
MGAKRFIALLLMAILLAGCSAKTETPKYNVKYDAGTFVNDTEEFVAKIEQTHAGGDVVDASLEDAADEYEALYGKDSSFEGKNDVTAALLATSVTSLYYDVKIEGEDDSYSDDLAAINRYIDDVKNAPRP